MRRKSQEFRFQRVYDLAALVEHYVGSPDSFMELEWDDPRTIECLFRPRRISLLHRYVFAMVTIDHRYEYRKNPDLFGESEIADIEKMLEAYEIEFLPFKEFSLTERDSNDGEDDPFYKWFRSQEDRFEELWERMTYEVFHLLYANRSFLLAFNRSLGAFLRRGSVALDSRKLRKRGRIKRARLPKWAARAVFYRDQGRCVLCETDLTGLLATDFLAHIDHIVPSQIGVRMTRELSVALCRVQFDESEQTRGRLGTDIAPGGQKRKLILTFESSARCRCVVVAVNAKAVLAARTLPCLLATSLPPPD